jgi:Ca-activated chloride channel family protein
MENDRPLGPQAPAGASTFIRHRTAWLAALLVVLTAAAGVAARVDRADAVAGGADARALRFAPSAGGPVEFGARLDREAVLVDGEGRVMMELVLRGREADDRTPVRTPTDLVVVLDRSGSMQGAALAHARASARELMARLDAADRFALVSYANDARVDIPLDAATDEAQRRWRTRLDGLVAQGGTNMARGLDLAHGIATGARTAGRGVRVILISDGHANQGDHSLEGLRSRAGRAVAGEFVLTTVGVGDGFDERLMTALADAGTGNFYYVREAGNLASVFSDEFLSARETVARALAVEIAPGEGVRVADAAGYPLERSGGAVFVRPGALFAGQERRLWLTLEVEPPTRAEAGRSVDLGRFALHYRQLDDSPRTLALDEAPRVAVVAQAREFYAAMDAEAYIDQLASDGLGRLRQRVAAAVEAGDGDRAQSLLDAFSSHNAVQLRALGYEAEENASLQEAGRMKEQVERALSPSAPPAAANALRKSLSSQGHDERRAGAKRSK